MSDTWNAVWSCPVHGALFVQENITPGMTVPDASRFRVLRDDIPKPQNDECAVCPVSTGGRGLCCRPVSWFLAKVEPEEDNLDERLQELAAKEDNINEMLQELEDAAQAAAEAETDEAFFLYCWDQEQEEESDA